MLGKSSQTAFTHSLYYYFHMSFATIKSLCDFLHQPWDAGPLCYILFTLVLGVSGLTFFKTQDEVLFPSANDVLRTRRRMLSKTMWAGMGAGFVGAYGGVWSWMLSDTENFEFANAVEDRIELNLDLEKLTEARKHVAEIETEKAAKEAADAAKNADSKA